MSRTRWASLVIVGAAIFFAAQGGEYATTDYLELRRRERDETAQITRLTRELDSLQRVARALETDPVVQERAAREAFGMIRRGEYLYRLVPSSER